MAITGMGFILFLLIHLIGNLTLYGGRSLFIAYVTHLHALSVLVVAAEIGLFLFAGIHVITGCMLFLENRRARPVRYSVKKNAGGRTIGSATMPYTGFIILCFLILHLFHFRLIDQTPQAIFESVYDILSKVSFKIIYMAAVLVVAIHIRHGFWSLFQTFGAHHPKYMPMIQVIGIAFAVLVLVGFGLIPVYIRFIL